MHVEQLTDHICLSANLGSVTWVVILWNYNHNNYGVFTLPDTDTDTDFFTDMIICRSVHTEPTPTPTFLPIKCRIIVYMS